MDFLINMRMGRSPEIEHGNDVNGQRQQQRDRERHVDEQPDLKQALNLDILANTP
jgi:hypothetical protein